MSDLAALEKSIRGGGASKGVKRKASDAGDEGNASRKQRIGALVSLPKVKRVKKRVQRAIQGRESLIIENIKKAMFLRGTNSSQTNNDFMKEFAMLKGKEDTIQLTKKNNVVPFEDGQTIEFLSNRNDCSLMVFSSHSKKRPNNITFARFFDHLLLDMFEVSLQNFRSLNEFKGESITTSNKPCFLFIGEEFEQNPVFKHKIFFRVYHTELKRSGSKTPHVELNEVGPSADFVMGRSNIAADEIYKKSTQIPKDLLEKKVKNQTKDSIVTRGRIHMQKEDLSGLQTRKKIRAFKAVRKEKGKEAKKNAASEKAAQE
ncbi:ribosome biogenesis protein RPF2 [Planoprotostelium fungivorum]|uniref:Ribosome production factor 2 homolog n=1 Tax=Planoprotostelium fungivorum TaxID=1890364 RepID=A0A2P6N1F4_9EUKA|nr:ribosome biogenesis protein RPF2 [Planoprotostelium fungivorum]